MTSMSCYSKANRSPRASPWCRCIVCVVAAGLSPIGPVVSRAYFQTAPPPEFEAASVRPAGPVPAGAHPLLTRELITGGPGTRDPGQITYSRVTIRRLIKEAYGVDVDQIPGPKWVEEKKYTIVAKVPPGSSREQSAVMLQNLLAKRFKLILHRQKKQFPVYALTMSEKGHKLKETADPNAQPMRPGGPRVPIDRDGFPVLPPGTSGVVGNPLNGIVNYTFHAYGMGDLVKYLGFLFGTRTGANTFAMGRIVDQTGLTSRYDFRLACTHSATIGGALSPPDLFEDQGVSGPSLTEALEKQLGLKLKKSTAELDVLVIDHAEKVPTEQ